MLGQRHKFHIIIVIFLQVSDQQVCQFRVGVPAVGIVRIGVPGTGVELIDIHGLFVGFLAPVHPDPVVEFVFIQVYDDRRAVRTEFHSEAVGIAVIDHPAAAVDLILVKHARSGLGNVELIDAVIFTVFHPLACPLVEFSDQSNLFRRRRVYPEPYAVFVRMGAEVSVGIKGFSDIEVTYIHKNPPICY